MAKNLNEKLAKAAMRNRASEVSKLIEQGADVNAYNDALDGAPLNYAAEYPDVVRVLMEAGADPLCRMVPVLKGRTPALHSAVQSHPDSVDVLLEFGVDPNAICVWDCHTAMRRRVDDPESAVTRRLAETLHDHGADFSICSDDGLSLVEVIEAYIEKQLTRYPKGIDMEPLMARPRQLIELIKPWALPPSYPDRWSITPEDSRAAALMSLAFEGRQDVIEDFLEKGVVESHGREALQLGLRGAIRGTRAKRRPTDKQLELVDRFLSLGAEINEDPVLDEAFEPLVFEAMGDGEMLKALIDRGVNLDVQDKTGKTVEVRLKERLERRSKRKPADEDGALLEYVRRHLK